MAFVLAVYAIPFGAWFGLLTGLARRLASLGWRVSVRRTANHFLFGSGGPK